MMDMAYTLFRLLIFAAVVCSLFRLWKGPTVADRLNAADVLALCCIGLVLGHGWARRDPIWLDVGLVAGLVLFVGTLATALFLSPGHLTGKGSEDE
ncbi:MAG: monovalent cation/H+ antiporter complex subunit F [Verrucomicrobiota bacterium]